MIVAGVPGSSPLVLVIDDDPTTRRLARSALEQGGFHVEEAKGGDQVLAVFEQLQPSLVLLDISLPGMDGLETCKQLRQLPAGSTTPVLIITGLDDEESINQAYDAGATDFTTKPVNPAILRHRVRYMIRTDRMFEARIRSEQKARALLNAIPATVFQIERDGTVLDYKPVRGVDTFLRPEEYAGRSLYGILPAKVADCCMEHVEKAFRTGNRDDRNGPASNKLKRTSPTGKKGRGKRDGNGREPNHED